MGDIFTGSGTYLMYCEDLTNTSSQNTNFKQIKNLSTFPTFQQSSEVSKLETYDSEYSNIQLGSMNIEPITITVNYVLNDQVLDQYYDNGTEFQLMLCMEDFEDVLNYIILNGQIASTQIDGDKDTQVTKKYSFETTGIQARGSIANTELYRGDFGVGSDSTNFPQNTTTNGNGFFLLDKNTSDNPLGVDLIGTQTVNSGKKAQILLSDVGTNPVMRIRSNTGPLIKVYTEFEMPTLIELGAASPDDVAKATAQIKNFVSENYYNKTQVDATFAKITYVDSSIKTVYDSIKLTNDTVTALNNTLTASINAVDVKKLNISGGEMTGSLILSGDATNVLGAVTKQQLDAKNAELKTYGDSTFATKSALASTKQELIKYVDDSIVTVNGSISTLNNTLTNSINAVDTKKLNITGGSMTGLIVLSGDATTAQNPASFGQLTGVVGNTRNLIFHVGAQATASMTADEIIVQTVLGGLQYKLTSFSKVINLGIIGIGGMNAGNVPAIGYVAIYAIFNPTTKISGLLAVDCTSIVAPEICGVAMPTGFTASALVSVQRVSGSLFAGGYQQDRTIVCAPIIIASGSNNVADLPVNLSACCPKNTISVLIEPTSNYGTSTNTSIIISPITGAGYGRLRAQNGSAIAICTGWVAVMNKSNIVYLSSGGGGTGVYSAYASGYMF